MREVEEASVDILVGPCEGAVNNHIISYIMANFSLNYVAEKFHFLLFIYTNKSNCRPEAVVQFSKSNPTNYLCKVLLMLKESWDSATHYHSSR